MRLTPRHHDGGLLHGTRFRPSGSPPPPKRERGAFGVMTAVLLIVIFGFCGLALDLSRMYNRKAELQAAADAIALAAAPQLDGTDAGITRAVDAALKAASSFDYAYKTAPFILSPAAISFASSPYASSWTDASSAIGRSGDLFFMKVDTAQLDPAHGHVDLLFMPVLARDKTSAQVNNRAVAGAASVNILPLAICALSETEGQSRGAGATAELVEYGFRRGINYDLMQLNPNGTTAGANFLVNPVAPSGAIGASIMSRLDVIQPFVCTGTLAIPPFKLATPSSSGGKITVEAGFPLGSVFNQLNSRFGIYSSPCTSSSAPPDKNVKQYVYSSVLTWMNNVPTMQSAEPRTTSTGLVTLPDLPPADIPAATTPGMYGPLWLYAKPALYSAYKAGVPEPTSGYSAFSPSDWPTLYPKGTPKLKSGSSYPTPTPYGSVTLAPTGATGVANRRVLNVPLLRCSAMSSGSPTSAEVLAIGKFFMTVQATNKQLFAEFAGLAQPSSLTGQVELYP